MQRPARELSPCGAYPHHGVDSSGPCSDGSSGPHPDAPSRSPPGERAASRGAEPGAG